MSAGSDKAPKQGAIPGPTAASLSVDLVRREVKDTYEKFSRVEFTWFPPEFTTSVAPNYEETPILGRSEPFFVYANTGGKTINLDLTFFADGSKGMPSVRGSEQQDLETAIDGDVLRNVRFLESLAYPILRADGLATEPAPCWLIIGRLYEQRVILTSAPQVTYAGPWETESLLPYQARVACEFTEVHSKPLHAIDVLVGVPPRAIKR